MYMTLSPWILLGNIFSQRPIYPPSLPFLLAAINFLKKNVKIRCRKVSFGARVISYKADALISPQLGDKMESYSFSTHFIADHPESYFEGAVFFFPFLYLEEDTF